MAICNLLSLTVRKNQNYEPEAMTTNQVYSGAVSSAVTSPASAQTDSVSLNGRIMDIMGTLTDEQIEAVFKVGYNKAVNDMIDIITTCSDITDEELISLYLGDPNKQVDSSKTRLRIVRNTSAVDAKNKIATTAKEAETKADEAYQALQKAQQDIITSKTNEESAKDSTKTTEEIEQFEKNALDSAKKAKEAAEKAKTEAADARTNAQKVSDARNKSQDSIDKANAAVALLDGNDATKKIKKLNEILDNTDDTDPFTESQALEKAAQEVINAADTIIQSLEERVSLREAEKFAQQAKEAAENANTETDPANAKNYAEQARKYAQDARDAVKNITDTAKINEINSIADGADALAYAVEAELKMKEAQTSITDAKDIMPPDEDLAKTAIGQAKSAVNLANKAREAAAKVDESVADAKSLKDKALGKVGLYDTDETTILVDGSIVLLDGSSTGTIEDARDEIFAEFGPGKTFPDIDPENPDETRGSEEEEDGGDGTDGSGPTTQKTSTIDLNRGDPEYSATITSSETVLTLKNPFTGSNYQYTITSLSGSQSAKFEFLANGRLVIRANNIKVVSSDNQKDDIILIGNNNELDSGDASDTIRIGYCYDSRVNSNQGTASNSDFSSTNEFGTTYYKLVTGNKINSGSGNDYVVVADNNYVLDTGDNNDKVRLIFSPNRNISNAEDVRTYDIQKEGTLDGIDGWANQGTVPDCRFFALINSIGGYGNLNNGSLDWAKIEDKGSSYKVTFPNYPASSGKNNYINISKSAITSYKGAYGDLDTIIISKALNDLIGINKDRSKTIKYDGNSYTADDSVTHAYYNTIAKYIYGSEEITLLQPNGWTVSGRPATCEEIYGADYQTCFEDLWNKYKSGEINNFTIGINTNNDKLGIISGHAYSIKDYNKTAGYIEITNPWDDADCLRLSLTDFFNLDTSVHIYGYDLYNQSLLIPNGGPLEYLSSSNISSSNLTLNIGYYGNNSNEMKYNQTNSEVVNSNPFANIFADSEPTIYDEIDEITASIENVKEILDEKKTFELFS